MKLRAFVIAFTVFITAPSLFCQVAFPRSMIQCLSENLVQRFRWLAVAEQVAEALPK